MSHHRSSLARNALAERAHSSQPPAAAATRLLEGFLFGVGASDPLTYTVTAMTFILVTAAAAYAPARRATRMDPLAALREE